MSCLPINTASRRSAKHSNNGSKKSRFSLDNARRLWYNEDRAGRVEAAFRKACGCDEIMHCPVCECEVDEPGMCPDCEWTMDGADGQPTEMDEWHC